jgi:outer membrane protein TolC
MRTKALLLASLTIVLCPAQSPPDKALGSVPAGTATGTPIDLTIEDALARGLRYNLALTEGNENVRVQRAERLRALSALLPTVTARPTVTEQQVSLAALGFSGFPGVPPIIGPFTVLDARGALSQSMLNLRSLRNYRAAREQVAATEHTARDLREQVVVVVTNLYLNALAGSARIEAQRSQAATADAAYRQAIVRKNAGTAPGIDVLRAGVELNSAQQRLIFYEGEFDKQRLALGRAIGLPPGQELRIVDTAPYTPLPPEVTLEATLQAAYEQRSDYRAGQALARAAELTKGAARAGRHPSAGLDANYGAIGQRVTQMHGSFTVVGAVEIPIFQGGRVQADVDEADAQLRQRRAELEDLRGRIDADVRNAFTDLRSAARQVEVAVQSITLARQQLQQAQDRFVAGVTNNLEVVQAQQAVALADENQIGALYAFNMAKAALVRARGDAERSIKDYLRRTQ